MDMNNTFEIIPGLVLATRTDYKPRQLHAFLEHHLKWCEKALVAVDLRPDQSASEIHALVKEFFPERVVVVESSSGVFSNHRTLNELYQNLRLLGEHDIVLHLDKDEFVSYPDRIPDYVRSIRSGQYDCAEGWMACRFAPGGMPYPDNLETFEAFHTAAPVRAEVIRSLNLPNRKIWLTRTPHIRLHDADHGWRKHPKLMVLDHFTWSVSRLEIGAEKALMMLNEKGWDGWEKHAANKLQLELLFSQGSPSFLQRIKTTLIPHSCSLPGFFDYDNIYRDWAETLPQNATVVELGVFRGRSLLYLAEYATLVGKKLKLYGVDIFDPAFKSQPFGSSEELMATLEQDAARACPWNRPKLIRGDTASVASQFKDGSVDALWIDADHSAEGVRKDIEAWKPKLAPGGIMAGHDYDWPSVQEGIRLSGLRVASVAPRSWVALP